MAHSSDSTGPTKTPSSSGFVLVPPLAEVDVVVAATDAGCAADAVLGEPPEEILL
jgi:hypothetical protein